MRFLRPQSAKGGTRWGLPQGCLAEELITNSRCRHVTHCRKRIFLPGFCAVCSKKPTWNFPTSRCQEVVLGYVIPRHSQFGSKSDKLCRHCLGGIIVGQLWGGAGGALSDAPSVRKSPHAITLIQQSLQMYKGGEGEGKGEQRPAAGAIC